MLDKPSSISRLILIPGIIYILLLYGLLTQTMFLILISMILGIVGFAKSVLDQTFNWEIFVYFIWLCLIIATYLFHDILLMNDNIQKLIYGSFNMIVYILFVEIIFSKLLTLLDNRYKWIIYICALISFIIGVIQNNSSNRYVGIVVLVITTFFLKKFVQKSNNQNL